MVRHPVSGTQMVNGRVTMQVQAGFDMNREHGKLMTEQEFLIC
jgi:hypothetical protein